jgi:hypothetical protein
MSSFLRGNPGLMAWLGIFLIAAVVITISVFFASSRGVSLKPIWWFCGFFLLVGLPQLIYHAFIPDSPSNARAKQTNSAMYGRPAIPDPETLFTVAPEGAVVNDIPPQSAFGVFARAEAGRHLTLPNGDTIMIARFQSATDASRAVGEYLRDSGLESSANADGSGGFVVPGNDSRFARVYASGKVLVMHATTEGLSGRPYGVQATDTADPVKRLMTTTSGKAIVASVLLVYTLLVSVYFLKGIAWGTRVDAKSVERVLSAAELKERLLALNTPDVPFQIEAHDDGELSATWNYADAKWVDLARARGMRRIHRVRMNLDEASRKVRATDYQSAYDWSAGAGGAGIAWKVSTGVVLFQYEHQRVYGLQLDSQGRPTRKLSYAYTFDLEEMKSPLIESVTQAGWQWQPVAWQAPPWLRWLAE